MSASKLHPYKGPIAAIAVTSALLGGGLVGALDLGSTPAVHAPSVLSVTPTIPTASGAVRRPLREEPVSAVVQAPTAAGPPAPSDPSTEGRSSGPTVVTPNRPLVVFGAQPRQDRETPDTGGEPSDG